MRVPEQQPLFRAEVLAEQQSQWLGTVLLAPRVSFRLFTTFALGAIAALLALLWFGDYTAKARINGWLVPEKGVIRIYSQQPGIVADLPVAEGEPVEAGAVLARISTEVHSDAAAATRQAVVERLRERRASMAAERSRRDRLFEHELAALDERHANVVAELAHLEREIELQRQRAELATTISGRYQELLRKGLTAMPRFDEAEQDRLDQAVELETLERSRTAVLRQRLQIEAERRRRPLENATLLATIDRDVALLDQEIAEAEARRESVLTAPVPGVVTGIQVEPGASVVTSLPLLSLVPADAALEAEMFAPGRAIGFVRPGQSVRLRYQAFPYQKFGFYQGTIASVSRAAVSPLELSNGLAGLNSLYGRDEPVYRLHVELERQTVTAYGEDVPLQAGLVVEADVLLETRRLFEWVLDPLYTLTGRS